MVGIELNATRAISAVRSDRIAVVRVDAEEEKAISFVFVLLMFVIEKEKASFWLVCAC